MSLDIVHQPLASVEVSGDSGGQREGLGRCRSVLTAEVVVVVGHDLFDKLGCSALQKNVKRPSVH